MICDLTTLGLSKEAVEGRAHSIGGSDANVILGGDEAKLLKLWEIKTGRAEEEDLSELIYVVMGQYTEPLNAAWWQKQTGLTLASRSEFLTCEMDEWRTATLDGRVSDGSIWEAKHTNPFTKVDEVLRMYLPQLHHNMDVANAKRAHLSAFRGNGDWVSWCVDYDDAYGAALHQAEWSFWMSVMEDVPPVAYPVPPDPTQFAVREVDMSGDNTWADAAQTWLDTRVYAAKADKAKDVMKAQIAQDVGRAFGHGVEFKRDKRGALRVYAMEA